jgi:hypothetical protein
VALRARFNAARHGVHSRVPDGACLPQIVHFIGTFPIG